MHNPCFCAAERRRRMNIVISACPMGAWKAPAEIPPSHHPSHHRHPRKRGFDWVDRTINEMGGMMMSPSAVVGKYILMHLAKICHSGVALTEQSPCPALRCGTDVHWYVRVTPIPICCFRCRGLRWYVRPLRCRTSIRCSIARGVLDAFPVRASVPSYRREQKERSECEL